MSFTALPYYGGKALANGSWVARQLPVTDTYVEPFAGMLGVLLKRPPVKCEIVNDLNGDIANWWRQMRDDYGELERLVTLTPRSRDHLEEANATLRNKSSSLLRRAWATHICLAQGMHGRTDGRASFRLSKNPSVGSPFCRWAHERFVAIADRVANIQIECTDATSLLERTANQKEAVIYVDPPYHSAMRAYKHADVDVDALTEALMAQRGKVALSGYKGEWEHLGWRSATFDTISWASPTRSKRVEVLWMNYPPPQETLAGFIA